MRYEVISTAGGLRAFDWYRRQSLGRYRWLWFAKFRAWWHVRVENPYREVAVYAAEDSPC